ncbi:MAG: DUF4491 family protein [Prevotella sp.]|nr:DUF4491 family protein [Prevotella sp.]
MEIYYTGVIIAVCTFFIIGMFHPLVIKVEYHSGTRYWWVFLTLGILSIGSAFFVADVFWSAIIGVLGASFLWSIGELFSQKKRVEKGWFPMNPKRKDEYQPIDKNETLCPVHHGRSIYAVED